MFRNLVIILCHTRLHALFCNYFFCISKGIKATVTGKVIQQPTPSNPFIHPLLSSPTMVQIASKFLALGAIFATTYALSLPKRDVTQVEADIASISTQVTNLDNAINAFPDTGGSITAALVRISSMC